MPIPAATTATNATVRRLRRWAVTFWRTVDDANACGFWNILARPKNDLVHSFGFHPPD